MASESSQPLPTLSGPVAVAAGFPLLVQYTGSESSFDVREWVTANEAALDQALHNFGSVLFRGFPVADAATFSAFVQGFTGWKDLPYEDSLSYAVRLPVVDRVCTTNEGKTGGMVWHHEQAAAPRYPSRVLFYCERPATTGGGTGITPSWTVAEALQARFPEFVARVRELGVRYRAALPPEQDPSKGVGRSWKSFFSVASKEEAEARMAALGYTWEWLPGDVLKTTTPVLPGVLEVPGPRGPATTVFFNQMVAQALANAKEFASSAGADGTGEPSDTAPPFLTFGDGSPVPLAPLLLANQVSDEHSVNVEWQAGDIAAVDNMTVMHARRAFDGPRRVLASLVQ